MTEAITGWVILLMAIAFPIAYRNWWKGSR